VIHHIRIFDLLPLLHIRESLPLNSRDIKNVRFREDFFNGRTLNNSYACAPCGRNHPLWHLEPRWRDKVEPNTVEAKDGDETMNSATVLKIPE
jgi:hypothetical protein